MVNHKINYNETLLPDKHIKLIREARIELGNILLPLCLKYHDPKITAVWELVTSGQREYTVLLKDIYSDIPELTGQLLQYLDHPLMGYLELPDFPPLENILKEATDKSHKNQ